MVELILRLICCQKRRFQSFVQKIAEIVADKPANIDALLEPHMTEI